MIRCFIIIFLFLHVISWGQNIDTKILTSNDGLLSNNVNKVFVDNKGVLWIGSRAGLAKRTINDFEIAEASLDYKFNNVFDICQDKYDAMWIAGYGQGILYFDKNKSKLINKKKGLISDHVRSLYVSKNHIYVGTLNGLSIIDLKTHRIVNPTFTKHIHHDFTVTSFFEFEGKFFITVLNDGVFELVNHQLIKRTSIKNLYASYVFQNKIFISTKDFLLELNPRTLEVSKKYSLGSVWEFLEYNDELYFVCSGIYESYGGLYKLSNGMIVDVNQKFKLPFQDIRTISFDKKKKLIYFGTLTNGLLQTNLSSPINKITEHSTFCLANNGNTQYVFDTKGLIVLENNQVTSLTELSKFKLLQNKSYKKFSELATRKNHFYEIDYNTPINKIMFYEAKIHQNNLWVASNIGFFQLNLKGELLNYVPIHVFNFTFFKNQLITPVPYGGVRVFREVSTMDYDYYHDYENPNIPAEIVSIAQTNEAVYFASALSGLYKYDGNRFTSLTKNNLFGEVKIKRIFSNKNNELIVITDFNELFILSLTSKGVKISKKINHQLIKGNSTSFVLKNQENIFVGTNKGINVFSPNGYYFIDKDQGLTSYNFNDANISNHLLYLSTKDGLYTLQANYFNEKVDTKIDISLKHIFINNEKLNEPFTDSYLQLSNSAKSIEIYYDVLNVKFPDKVHLKYRLKDHLEWKDITQKNKLNLIYLEPGTYEIQFLVQDEDNGSHNVNTLLKIKINPPFYLTLPFILGSGIFLIICVGIYNKIRLKKIKKNQEIETKQLIYEKQLSDVKLQALRSQMNSHFLFNILGSIQYFILTQNVDEALYHLDRFSSLIRSTLDFSDKKSVSLYDELSYLEKYIEIENLRKDVKVKFSYNVGSDISLTQVHIIPLLLQPFVENSMIHAFSSSIKNPEIFIEIRSLTNEIEIVISDNGVGYRKINNHKHHSKGVSIVQRRLDLTQKNLNKKIDVFTSDKGTKVTILIDGIKLT